MPAIARGNNTDTVSTGHGCDSTTTTKGCSSTVTVNGKGVVRVGDLCEVHTFPVGPSCVPHTLALSTNFSATVSVEGKKVAFVGSAYGGTHVITSGSPTVSVS